MLLTTQSFSERYINEENLQLNKTAIVNFIYIKYMENINFNIFLLPTL